MISQNPISLNPFLALFRLFLEGDELGGAWAELDLARTPREIELRAVKNFNAIRGKLL